VISFRPVPVDDSPLLTAEQFAAADWEQDLATPWTELTLGRLVTLDPPSPEHGAVVLNLSKALAGYLQRAPDEKGYACFEIGLVVARNPDTVRRPPISLFVEGERFAELERRVAQSRPALVIEIASTNDRRRDMRARVESYLALGVRTIWVADTVERSVHVIQPGRPPRVFSHGQSLIGKPVFADFKLPVGDLFKLPE
jgi:Uma2 family endonuclease